MGVHRYSAHDAEDVHQFGDGVRVRLHLGNLTSATISGATLKLKYGSRRPGGGPDFLKRFSTWRASLKDREQKVLEELHPGNWNPVTVVLPEVEEKSFGYLEVSIETSRISLYSPRR